MLSIHNVHSQEAHVENGNGQMKSLRFHLLLSVYSNEPVDEVRALTIRYDMESVAFSNSNLTLLSEEVEICVALSLLFEINLQHVVQVLPLRITSKLSSRSIRDIEGCRGSDFRME